MIRNIALFAVALLLGQSILAQQTSHTVQSPNGQIEVTLSHDANGTPFYHIIHQSKIIITPSALGLVCKNANFHTGLTLVSAQTSTHDETWNTVWGEEERIRDHHNALETRWRNATGQELIIRFKVFDNGVGFRYEIPGNGEELVVLDEKTAFDMPGDHTTWWAPLDWDSNEHTYTQSRISEIDATKYQNEIEPFNQYIPYKYGVQTPVTMKTPLAYISIAEAALRDYGALQLKLNRERLCFEAFVVPTADSTVKSVNRLPFQTPWRVILINEDAGGLLTNRTILNLNEPCQIQGDLSWIKPQKYVGVWWEMHVGKGSWEYASAKDKNTPNGRHSANTANVKRYIDFAAKHGFAGVLVEGWNVGWEEWFNTMKPEVFDFTKPYPDYDMDELADYAAAKGVKIIMHHETSSAVPSYERQMDAAYAYMKKHGIAAAKTGYVGYIQPKGEWHDGQRMVNHYEKVARKMAENKLMVDMHEPVRPSGLHRTWPNFMTSEAGRGMEYNAWSKGNAPSHVITLPFTRLLGGPMDYTPGIFETRTSTYDPNKKEIVHSTIANQLALYVTMYSPMQMAADLPENYESRPREFQFIKDVPVDWSETKVLNASIGEYLTVARREKGKNNWYIGSINNETERTLRIKLDFLEPGKTYEATIYADGKGAHYKKDPYRVAVRTTKVQKDSTLMLRLASGGGCAIAIKSE